MQVGHTQSNTLHNTQSNTRHKIPKIGVGMNANRFNQKWELLHASTLPENVDYTRLITLRIHPVMQAEL